MALAILAGILVLLAAPVAAQEPTVCLQFEHVEEPAVCRGDIMKIAGAPHEHRVGLIEGRCDGPLVPISQFIRDTVDAEITRRLREFERRLRGGDAALGEALTQTILNQLTVQTLTSPPPAPAP
jgi:hypothetical protein